MLGNDEKFPDVWYEHAGLAHAVISAHILLGKPIVCVREAPKSHGRNNRIEGAFERDKVVVVEDLISKKYQRVVEALREAGAEGFRGIVFYI